MTTQQHVATELKPLNAATSSEGDQYVEPYRRSREHRGKNLEAARKFYQDTLGLKQVGAQGEELIVFKSGSSMINVYRSQFAGTNQATAVT